MTIPGTQATNQYGRYLIPKGLEARPAAKKALAGAVYEPQTIAFMRRHAGGGDVIHAGAFFGDFIPALCDALAPGARLWAFEPNPGNFAAAQETIAMNDLDNVTLTHAALSNRAGQLLFKTSDESGKPLGGLSQVVDAPGPGVEPVPAQMLDFAVPMDRHVSILQLDVEGHEKQALKGAYHLINRCQPILILEYLGQQRWLNRTFRDVPYVQIGKLHGNFVYVPQGSGITL
ncbi:FkbM family methyltransferase [Tropicibacter naphthalenivorans]|uniref:Methyltransferase, FkbM family n=1 Tax=Tropicibacter naphthalenivorans TaxID=441103 RepID=A0A0P1H0E2_9RHOB|nr:FkbM family methyltransferase [Tropicibacter naphthalenivorans]CUH79516.1 methyltransferase, FkbM family [Tropicibacter naphthalenivorans]SMC73283.1 methyltransferase, FkbM family [Tropicibacter naphthalenivorans]